MHLRASKKAQTRTRLERAALELFDRFGYDEVTTNQIAEAAGVSPRTFFRYFPTKLDALLGDALGYTRDFFACLYRQPLDRDLLPALLSAITEFEQSGLMTDEENLIRVRIMSGTPSLASAVRGFENEIEGHFAAWIAHRSGRPVADFDVRVVAEILVAGRRVVSEELQASGITTPSLELIQRALANIEIHMPPTSQV